MSRTYAGAGQCPDCDEWVLFAVGVDGDLIPLSTGPDGPVVVGWDCTRTPRARLAGPRWKPREGEHRFAYHRDSCKALARIIPLTARTRLRQTGANRRYA
jgi:hypothetical protein